MRKAIAAVVIVLLVGIGGYLGVTYWAQRAAAREVDAVLDRWRGSVGTVTRGRVDFDLWTRTLKVTDVVAQAQSGGQPRLKVAQVVASGIDASGKASHVDIADLELTDATVGQPGVRVQQKARNVRLTDFSARPLPPRKPAATSLERTRLWLEQFSAITAASIEIPSLTVTVVPEAGDKAAAAMGPAEYTYSNLVLRGVRDGRVAEATTDGIVFRGSMPGATRELSGEIGSSTVTDADMRPLIALLDPALPQAQGYQRIYRRMAMGPYSLRFGDGGGMRIDSVVAEDIGLQASKLSLDDLIFLSEVTAPDTVRAGEPGAGPPGVPGVGQMSMLMDKMAGLYEAFHLGKLEIAGVSVTAGERDRAQIASIRIDNLENGRFGELAIDGLDAKPPAGAPFKLGRVAVRGFDFAGLMRIMATALSQPTGQHPFGPPRSRSPNPEQIAAMLRVLEGVELENVALPDPKTRRLLLLDSFKASWGQFVGGVPSQSRVTMKFSAPIGAPDPEPFINLLAGAGIQVLTTGVDVGARWSEPAQAVTLEPATVEIDGAFALSVKGTANNVSRDLFSTDVLRAIGSAASIEVGPIEVTLRDLGLIDLVAAEIARPTGQGPDVGRSLLLQAWEKQASTQPDPGAQPFFQAMRQFVQGKGETLTVRLTPKGHVRALELAEALRLDPAGAVLAGFTVEATSGK
ncbi:MAG TPA: hypothetical protein VFY92_12435 [Hyphomicrobiaceae bacterium]|nr:hypothetical protein [Hyphomicrobiaceae bacterium]